MCRQRLRRPAPRRPAAPGRRYVAFVAEQPEKRRSETRGDQQMPATLKLTHKAIGAEVRRGTYDVVVDGERAGSVEMNHTIEIQSSLGVTPCESAMDEIRAALKSSTPPRKRSSPSDCLPMHRKEALADLSRILCRAQAGTETRSRLSRRCRCGAHQTSLSPPGCRSRPGTKPWPEGVRPPSGLPRCGRFHRVIVGPTARRGSLTFNKTPRS